MKKFSQLVLTIISSFILLFNVVGCSSPTTSVEDQTTITSAPATTEAQNTTTLATTTTKVPTTTTKTQPTTTTTEAKQELSLEIISVTSPVSPGEDATLEAKTTPGAECTIVVLYKSGSSRAKGLIPKTADSDGTVSWTWRVGTRTTPGDWPIYVTASSGGKTVIKTTSFTVQ